MNMPIENAAQTAAKHAGNTDDQIVIGDQPYANGYNQPENAFTPHHEQHRHEHSMTQPPAPSHLNVGVLLRAQSDFIKTQFAYIHDTAKLAELAAAQEGLIEAQAFVLHQLGIV